jgi:DNA-binding HxlR family transcriptional regulator
MSAARRAPGRESGARTGAQALALFAVPLCDRILRSLATGSKQLRELRDDTGSPARSELPAQLKTMEAFGVVARQRPGPFPSRREYELTGAGGELRFVAVALERWLAGAEAPLALGDRGATTAIEALVGAWSSTMLRALVGQPLTLRELDRRIDGLDRRSLEQRLAALRLNDMVEPGPARDGETPFVVTERLRRSVGSVVAASRWERRNLPEATAPIGRIDAEAALLMAAPLLALPPGREGACRFVVELPEEGDGLPAEVTIQVRDRKVVSCISPGAGSDTYATGPPVSWFRVAIEADPTHLETGGDRRLARSLLDSIYGALFGRHSSGQIRIPTQRTQTP